MGITLIPSTTEEGYLFLRLLYHSPPLLLIGGVLLEQALVVLLHVPPTLLIGLSLQIVDEGVCLHLCSLMLRDVLLPQLGDVTERGLIPSFDKLNALEPREGGLPEGFCTALYLLSDTLLKVLTELRRVVTRLRLCPTGLSPEETVKGGLSGIQLLCLILYQLGKGLALCELPIALTELL